MGGHADADREPQRLPLMAHFGVFDGAADVLGDGARHLDLPVRQDHHEFLAAVAAEDVLVAELRIDDLGDLLQAVVAAGVAQLVVDRLEMVDIDEQHRQRRALAVRVLEGARQRLVETAAIQRAGQRIDFGGVAQMQRGHGFVGLQQRQPRQFADDGQFLGMEDGGATAFQQDQPPRRRAHRQRDQGLDRHRRAFAGLGHRALLLDIAGQLPAQRLQAFADGRFDVIQIRRRLHHQGVSAVVTAGHRDRGGGGHQPAQVLQQVAEHDRLDVVLRGAAQRGLQHGQQFGAHRLAIHPALGIGARALFAVALLAISADPADQAHADHRRAEHDRQLVAVVRPQRPRDHATGGQLADERCGSDAQDRDQHRARERHAPAPGVAQHIQRDETADRPGRRHQPDRERVETLAPGGQHRRQQGQQDADLPHRFRQPRAALFAIGVAQQDAQRSDHEQQRDRVQAGGAQLLEQADGVDQIEMAVEGGQQQARGQAEHEERQESAIARREEQRQGHQPECEQAGVDQAGEDRRLLDVLVDASFGNQFGTQGSAAQCGGAEFQADLAFPGGRQAEQIAHRQRTFGRPRRQETAVAAIPGVLDPQPHRFHRRARHPDDPVRRFRGGRRQHEPQLGAGLAHVL